MENLVTTLVKQHRVLQKEALELLEYCNSSKDIKFDKIDKGVKKFSKSLTEHLDLENKTFYVGLLEQMKKAGQDTSKTELFISEMRDIEKVINVFLEEFKDEESIKNNFVKFCNDFTSIKEVLVLRIESEEAGVYSYWGLF